MSAPHPFDILNSLRSLSEDELSANFDGELAHWLTIVQTLLFPLAEVEVVDRSSIARVVRRSRQQYEMASHRTSEVILAAGELEDRGEWASALAIWYRFYSECTSPFYAEIAARGLARVVMKLLPT
jgi:hypothetical protein